MALENDKYLLVIVGPTAVGKTNLCINLAKKIDTEIVSSDSRQFYREMELGTAKPSEDELREVKHHFVNNLSIFDDYDVRKFEKEALELMENLFKSHDILIMTGGSGLFVNAICEGFDDIPDIDPSIRASLNDLYQKEGIVAIQEKLKELDPEYYAAVDLKNPQRLIRGCEVSLGTGKPFSSYRLKKKVNRPFKIIKVGLEREREELYDRINYRMDLMIEAGLFEEAEKLFPYRELNALQTVGYSEIFNYLEGEYGKEEAIRLLKRNSRRYAKRQLTWFRRDNEIRWFSPEDEKGVFAYIQDQIA
ncbi:tRNA (adenosine(37)-N6)-dimethylallyltransferase MiaA [Echinicola salinicaeni]|uniref:tRNA (adenosine(37)-N6)-dimethylallyltransferase MiaA n=1 Tax=Echinicola salinicaeni TaxID=2762757 RepID=UPI00164636D5|nr:tRNA (adenosine(37)-N6)-dimethylallyltransferase MiaA [Echinicola salinicaeni]